MDVVPIWLWHTPGAHDDLQLELGDLRHGCCSCNLLLLDDTLTHETDSFGALARFLQLWLDELDKLRQRPGVTFLPHDFYDEGSSWLRVLSDDTIEATVVAGERSFQGLFLKASEFGEYAHLGFHPWAGTELTCDLNDLIRTLVENRDALNSRSELPVYFLLVVPAGGGSVWLHVCVGDVAEPFARMDPDTAESRTPSYR